MTGLALAPESLRQLFTIDAAAWRQELAEIGKFFDQFGTRLPEELYRQTDELRQRLESGRHVSARSSNCCNTLGDSEVRAGK